ncbi:MAG TPA: family 2A encapsulin nanocompartment cargo protein cysteine desulfurase [Ferruginibacter sp.]|nr:family 2A encapsulin nanocompartment cargo protein cysteine desulfurase [Ferruginibacter sp.]
MSINTNSSLPEIDLTGAQQALAAGFPDPAVLALYANEFIKGIEKKTATPQLPVDANKFTSVSPFGISPQLTEFSGEAENKNITEEQLKGLATGNEQTQLLPQLPANVPSFNSPGIPGGFSAESFSSVPSFSFIEEARSPFNSANIPVQSIAPAAKIPTETEFRGITALPGNFPASVPPTPLPSVGSPLVPGAVERTGDIGHPAAFSFLDTSRTFSSINVVPTLSPLGNEPNFAPDKNLSAGLFDVHAIRRDFPILSEKVNGKNLVWLDNAATTQKPQSVIDRIAYFYEHENSNVHRAAHTLAARSTDAYDAAREKVQHFLNASSVGEIIFVRGATEGINLIAKSWGQKNINEGDEIVISHLEHHANIVPWQMLCSEKGARLRVIPVDNDGQILLDEYEKLLGPKTRLVSFTQVSNALGTVTPVKEMVEIAHRYGAKVLVDGAQAISHMAVDVQLYDCDFYVFSGHKVFGPTGIGVVYGKKEILDATPPWQGGGNMIVDVTFEKTVYNPAPFRFEAGTGNIADAVGLGAAIDYVERIGMANIARYEHELLVYATNGLKQIPGLRLIGTAREKASVLSFVLDGYTTEQVGQALNKEGIAVRSGHHCAQPILRRFGVESSVRPSLAFYNTCEEIDLMIATIWNLRNGRSSGI